MSQRRYEPGSLCQKVWLALRQAIAAAEKWPIWPAIVRARAGLSIAQSRPSMRIVALALLSLTPVLALGQNAPTAGQAFINEGSSTGGTSVVNIDECSGADPLTIQWTNQLTTGTLPPPGSTYKIVASDTSECPF